MIEPRGIKKGELLNLFTSGKKLLPVLFYEADLIMVLSALIELLEAAIISVPECLMGMFLSDVPNVLIQVRAPVLDLRFSWFLFDEASFV